MLETAIERYFKQRLEFRGWKVLKLVTPGTMGVNDRLILRPRYWPGPPMVVEFKKPDKKPRPLQDAMSADFMARGVHVLPYVDSMDKARDLIDWLFHQSEEAYNLAVASQVHDSAALRAISSS